MTRFWMGLSGRTRILLPMLLTAPCILLMPALLGASGQLPLRVYTPEDGLAHSRVKRVVQDSRGFLWFCTAHGLSRFDGTGFTNFFFPETVFNPSTNDLLETEEAVFWVATNGAGLVRFNAAVGGAPHPAYRVAPESAANRVNVLFRRANGSIWLGTDGGLFRLVSSPAGITFDRIPLGLETPDILAQVFSIAEDREGSLWIGGNFGILRQLPDGRMLRYSIRPNATYDLVNGLHFDPQGRLWIAHYSGVVAYWPLPAASHPATNGGETTIPAARATAAPARPGEASYWVAGAGSEAVRVSAISQSPDGRIWIGTQRGGILQFDGRAFVRVPLNASLERDVISGISPDRDGNLWLASQIHGAVRVGLNGFVTYRDEDGLDSPVCGTFVSRSGEFVVSNGTWRLSVFDGANFTSTLPRGLGPQRGPNCASDQSVIQDHLGEWWIGTNTGLFHYPAVEHIQQLASTAPKAVYTARDGLDDIRIRHIQEDAHGDLWISAFAPEHSVVTQWQRATGTFRQYTEADGLPRFNAPSALLEDHAGDLWITFRDGGLARRRNGRFQWFGPAEGVPAGNLGNCVSDRDNRLWCAHLGLGVLRFDDLAGDRLVPVIYSSKDGLSSDFVYRVGLDDEGHIYAATVSGLDQIDPVQHRTRRYSVSEGLPLVDIAGIFHHPGSGLWIASATGLTHLSETPFRKPESPPVLISAVRIGGVAYPVPAAGARQLTLHDIPPEQNSMQIDYLGISGAGSALRFRYRLTGADPDWSEPTRDRSVTYPRLPSGSYSFSVVAVAADGATSAQPATISFRILPPFWRRWWFLAACLAAIGIPVLAFSRYRARKLAQVRQSELALRRSREEHLAELERVRRRIAIDLHDDVGSSLTHISILSEVAQQRIGNGNAELHQPLSLIGDASRELLDSMSDIVWSINPQRDRLGDLLHRMRRVASDTLTGRDIAFQLRLPEDGADLKLDATVRREVFLIFKESLTNLVRHSGCTRAEIEFGVDGGKLRLVVSDNGSGIRTEGDSDGHGLASMRRRAEEIHGTLDIASTPGVGVTVTLEAPLAQAVHYENS